MCAAFFIFSKPKSLIIVEDYIINVVDCMINVDDYMINVDD